MNFLRTKKDKIIILAALLIVVIIIILLSLPKNESKEEFILDIFEFNGKNQIVYQNKPEFSPAITKNFSISVWLNPNTTNFSKTEGSGYVHWMGKGRKNEYEWAFRIYNIINEENRSTRISFYLFNKQGGQGIGSYFQDNITLGEWIHIAVIYNGTFIQIYRNSILEDQDDASSINLQNGSAPLSIGTLDGNSYFEGKIARLRIENKIYSKKEIEDLYIEGLNYLK